MRLSPHNYFGMRYIVPEIEHHDRTILAVKVGGCVIPVALSMCLLLNNPIVVRATLAVAIVAALTHPIARPVPGLGIAMPVFLPPLLAALTAVWLDRDRAAPPWPTSPAVWTRCWAPTPSICIVCRNWALPWPPLAAPACRTGSS